MENLRKRINVKLVNNEKQYLKCTSKPSYMSHNKIFDNSLVAIRKSKLALKLNKTACIGMCILELNKLLMYKFHYCYIKNKYETKSELLCTDIDSVMYKIKIENVYKDFQTDKEMFGFSIYSTKSKYYDNSSKMLTSKMKDETACVETKERFELKSKMYLFLVNNSEHKKAKGRNTNIV